MNRGIYKPRDYQQNSIGQVRAACSQGKKTILVLPTGGGKTKTAVYGIVQKAISKGAPVVWLAHRVELIGQADADLLSAGVRTGIIRGSTKPDPSALCQVASIQTLCNRLDKLPPAKVVVIDECHHVRSATYMSVVQRYQQTGAIIVGLTATPERLDGKGLGDVFDTIVETVTVRELIESGHLADYEYFAPSLPDLTGVKKTAGDFHRGGAAAAMDKPTITGNLVRHYQKHLGGRRALVFAAGVDHSKKLVAAFDLAGIAAAHLDAKTPEAERRETLAKFGAGDIQVVSNVDLFDEGFDVPACQGVVIARPTQSFVKHRQMIGRCLRVKADGSRAIILDHAGNFLRHGMPDDITEWSLDDKAKTPTETPSYKQCPQCFAVLAIQDRACHCCGYVFTRVPRSGPEFQDGTLEKVKQKRWTTSEKRDLYRTLMAKARASGYMPGWAKRQYRNKTKVWPKGFVDEIDRASFRLCKHRKMSQATGRCKHCGDYCGPGGLEKSYN